MTKTTALRVRTINWKDKATTADTRWAKDAVHAAGAWTTEYYLDTKNKYAYALCVDWPTPGQKLWIA